MAGVNANLGVIDHATEVSIAVNAVFFDLDVLVAETLIRFSSFDSLPVDEIIDELVIDKEIPIEDAESMLNAFTLKYYDRGIYDEVGQG